MKLEILTSELLKPVKHGFFTRKGGISSCIYKGLNCGLGSLDSRELVQKNRQKVCKAMDIKKSMLLSLNQVHSNKVLTLNQPFHKKIDADAMVTNKPNLGLGILTADCQPVVFADIESQIIGVAHAGWRGTLSGILDNTISSMIKLGATRQKIKAVIGPSISQKVYKVGSEFFEKFYENNKENEKFFKIISKEKFLFDLSGLTLEKLTQSGVTAEKINRCTYLEPDLFYSYRRSLHKNEKDYGRQITVIRL